MENVTALNVLHQKLVEEVLYKILDVTDGEPNEVVLAAIAEIITIMSGMDLKYAGIDNAYDYIVTHARDSSGDSWIKVAPGSKPTTVTPFKRPEKKDEE